MGQTQPDIVNGLVTPPEMKRFVFLPVEEAHVAVPSSAETAALSAPEEKVSEVSAEYFESDFSALSPPENPAFSVAAANTAPAQALPADEETPQFPLFQFGQNGPENELPGAAPVYLLEEEIPVQGPARRPAAGQRLLPSGVAHFQQMLAQFQTFPACHDDLTVCLHDNPYAISVIQSLAAKSDDVLTWEDLDRMETALVQVLPETRLRSQAWSYRARYFDSAGSTLTALYLASRPVDWNDATVPVEQLRADLETLVCETQRNRVQPPELDFTREYMSELAVKWAVGLFLGGIVGFVTARFVLAPSDAAPIIPFAAAVLSGAVGGFLSLHGRLSRAVRPHLSPQDQIQAVLDVPNLYLFPVQGAALAAIFYFLLLGGYVRGTLLPNADLETLATPAGAARLIVWCFALGFLVRFVPDFPKMLRRRFARRQKVPASSERDKNPGLPTATS